MEKKTYIVSFGGSDEYSVAFSGTIEELEKSECFRNVIDGFRKSMSIDFPDGNYDMLISPHIREANRADGDYPELTPEALRQIRHHLKREGEVLMANRKLDRNAPFAETD